MPQNPSTGKTDRRPLSEAAHLEHRRKLADVASDSGAGVKKGKQRARDPPGSAEQAPSPSTHLAGFGTLTLDSGSSHATAPSYATTPAHSPAISPQPTLPEHPAPAPLPVRSARIAAKKALARESSSKAPAAAPIGDSAGASRLLMPTRGEALRSHSDASAASDGRSNAARISVLESRLDELEQRLGNWANDFNLRLKDLGM